MFSVHWVNDASEGGTHVNSITDKPYALLVGSLSRVLTVLRELIPLNPNPNPSGEYFALPLAMGVFE